MSKKRVYEITDDEVLGEFEDKYHCLVMHQYLNDDRLSYRTSDKLYDLSFLSWGDMMDLVERSLKEDKNILFEACKDKQIPVTKEQWCNPDFISVD
ncbi:MAG: hypothetical protein ACTTJ6_01965 [Treponema sp.]